MERKRIRCTVAAKRLGVTSCTISRMVKDGRLERPSNGWVYEDTVTPLVTGNIKDVGDAYAKPMTYTPEQTKGLKKPFGRTTQGIKNRTFILCVALLLLASCSPAKRLQRLVDKHPELRDTVTVTVHDTVIVPGDTVYRPVLLRGTDTVYVTNDRQTVRVIRIPTGSPCDTALFRADILATVKADTVVVTNTIEVPRIAPCPKSNMVASWWRIVALCLGAVLVLIIWIRKP